MTNVVKRLARGLLGFVVAFGTALGVHAQTSTTTSLTAAISTTTFGQSVTFVATIASGAGTPTGTVAFRSDGVNIGTCAAVNIVSGVANCTTTVLAVGSH